MELFKRILQEETTGAAAPTERRSSRRFAISPEFALKAGLSLVGRDDTGMPMSNTRHGWNWKGRLIDCSEQGVRIQMGPALKAEVGDPCDLKLSVEDFELSVPSHLANISENSEGIVFGLKHAIEDEATLTGYRQLIEVVALGSTLKPHAKTSKQDESGYFLEHYVSNRPARLSIWRHPANTAVAAFEFQLKDNVVRAAAGQGIEFLTADGARPASAVKAMEIERLFHWVVPNLAPAVPEDVRHFLRHYTA